MIDVAGYLKYLAERIEKGEVKVETFELTDDLIQSKDLVRNKNKYIKTGTTDLRLILREE